MSIARQTEIIEQVASTCSDDNVRIKIRQRDDYLFKSAEYATAQTATSFIAAPAAGNKIVIKGVALAGDGTTGEVIINGTVGAATIIIAKLYVTKANSLSQESISIPLDAATAVTITTTTGTDKVLAKINYVVDEV